jgi:hypothetical protein
MSLLHTALNFLVRVWTFFESPHRPPVQPGTCPGFSSSAQLMYHTCPVAMADLGSAATVQLICLHCKSDFQGRKKPVGNRVEYFYSILVSLCISTMLTVPNREFTISLQGPQLRYKLGRPGSTNTAVGFIHGSPHVRYNPLGMLKRTKGLGPILVERYQKK